MGGRVFVFPPKRYSKRRQQDLNLRPQRGTDTRIRICRRNHLAIAPNDKGLVYEVDG